MRKTIKTCNKKQKCLRNLRRTDNKNKHTGKRVKV